jgi:uncharacterized membrane protein YgcG
MKYIKRISALLFAVSMLLLCFPVFASFTVTAEPDPTEEHPWRGDLRRMNDLSGILTQADSDELNEKACDLALKRRFDFVIILYTDEHKGSDEDARYINYIYNKNRLGYGESRDGIVLAVNTQHQTFIMEAFGRGTEIFTDNAMNELSFAVRNAFQNGRYPAAIDSFIDEAAQRVGVSPYRYDGDADYDEDAVAYSELTGLNEYDMPDWYPEDVNAWVFTPASPDAPRVVDDADLFTDDEERRLEERIAEIAPKYQADIVIFTDVSTHGLSHGVYAADFYDFNGYGYGPEHDGFCLMICMDPADRGGWCCVAGAPRALYTEQNANDLDDVLYEYLGNGQYFTGVYDWIGNIGTLLDKGIPFAPPWYPSRNEDFIRRNDPNKPRIVDDGGVLTAEQETALAEKAKRISEKYGLDVVIHTTGSTYGLSSSNYCRDFYYYNGYGFGDKYTGTQLTLLTDGSGYVNMLPEDTDSTKLTPTNIDRLIDGAQGPANSGDYYKAADRWLNYLERTLKTGRTPRTPFVWGMRSLIASFVSLIGSGIHMAGAKSSMKTVRTAYTAGEHLTRDSMGFESTRDEFIRSTVSKVYSPVSRESSSGSSGHHGGSSYSGGYHGSSGSSHSGSGRKF